MIRVQSSLMSEFYRRHLPHWQPRDAIFFVTFRLKNSLPYEVVESMRAARKPGTVALKQLARSEQALEEHRSFVKWDAVLDQAKSGPRWISQPGIAEVVKEAMHYRDGKVFDLHAFCIMSNHVHAIFKLISMSDWQSDVPPLNKVMQSLKRHTARQANILLGREGAFWQDESYDRVIRNHDEYARLVHYVLENPVKAGLVSRSEDWPWSYCK
jgi:REP element-mobilizing transposase RayT